MFRCKNTKCSVLVLALLGLISTGCHTRVSPEQTAPIKLPQRIVSISPNVTEILYGVGAWSQVVAVSQYCTYPDDAKNKARVSGWDKTNLEQITALKPDLVIGVDAQAPALEDNLNDLGIRSLFVKSQTLADVYDAIGEIGRVSGHEPQAAELQAKTQGEVEAVRKAVADRQNLKVLCVVDRVPGTIRELYTATRGSYLDELITIAGGESIAPRAEHGYGKITKEAAVSLNPEVIIDMVQGSKGNFGEDPIAIWRELSEVRAVKEKRIYPISDPRIIHPSQFVGHTAQVFARAIHPEAFPDGP
jgi:iron complex transport system substrate-binding protein